MQASLYSTTRSLIHTKPACFDVCSNGEDALLKRPDNRHKLAEGGLRTHGLFKQGSDQEPLVTVITVVYNGARFLEETIKSVLEQTYDNVEYIVIDGGSKDNTLDLIRKYEDAIDYWVSEPDSGIYDAMNKGIELASGDWISFMNVEDCFYNADTLSKVFNQPKILMDYDVVYGDHQVIYPHKKRIAKAGKIKNFWKGSQFCHQSAFVKRFHYKKNKFNVSRKIAADFEFFYKAYKSGLKMKYMPIVVSNYSAGGLSDIDRIDSILERWLIIEKNNFINMAYVFIVFYTIIKMNIKEYVFKK